MLKTVGNLSVRSGDQTILNGNLIIGTAGKGIDFSAAAHAAGMTSELLDDYEEGTWTPVLGGAGGETGQSYTTQQGYYRKVGDIVFFSFFVELSNFGSPSNEAVVKGLPFQTASQLGHGAGFVSLFGNLAANVAYLSLRTSPSSDFFYFASTPAAAASSVNQISWQMYTNTTYVNGGGFYIAA